MSPHLATKTSRVPSLRRACQFVLTWSVIFVGCSQAGLAQRETSFLPAALTEPAAVTDTPNATAMDASSAPIPLAPVRPWGEIRGVIGDPTGDIVPGARITLERPDSTAPQITVAADDGTFAFAHVSAGAYRITVTAPGFKPWLALGTLAEGQKLALTRIALPLSSATTEIEVSASSHDVAAAQLGLEEQQRVLGIFPNFYASYVWNAEPLSARQKLSLAWRFSIDPVAFGMAGLIAGTEQAENSFSGYSQGTLGYAKRFGAIYADGFSSTMLGQAILPAVFHQDPRYFVKGKGSFAARALYAVATTVICRGDNGHWQANYSNILGNLASAGISNAYYPDSDRHGASLTIQNSMVTTGLGAIGGLFQEFFLHRMTPHIPDYNAIARE